MIKHKILSQISKFSFFSLRQSVLVLLLCGIVYSTSFLDAAEGTVFLSDGKQYSGKILFTNSLRFWDIHRNKRISFALSQVYRICTIEESWEFSKHDMTLIKKNYLTQVTTWEGDSYWGKFSTLVIVREKRKERKFILAKEKKDFLKPQVVEILMKPGNELIRVPQDYAMSLSGQIHFPSSLEKVYIVHQDWALVFSGKIFSEKERYEILELMPGIYDLVFVGKECILFGLSSPPRKQILDKKILDSSKDFQSWMESQTFASSTSRKKLAYVVGHESSVRAIVIEEIPLHLGGKRLYWLCLCSYRSQSWTFQKFVLLSEQKISEEPLVMILSENLAKIILPIEKGPRIYDCSWDGK